MPEAHSSADINLQASYGVCNYVHDWLLQNTQKEKARWLL